MIDQTAPAPAPAVPTDDDRRAAERRAEKAAEDRATEQARQQADEDNVVTALDDDEAEVTGR